MDERDDVRWLALLIRRALLMIVMGIEQRYGIKEKQRDMAA